MTNEIVKYDPMEAPSIFDNDETFSRAKLAAKVLSDSTMVPDIFKGPSGYANAILAYEMSKAMRVNFWYFAKEMYSVHGKVGVQAKLLISMFERSGEYTPIQYDTRGDVEKCINESDGTRAYSTHRKTGERIEGPWVTWKMAKDSGWLDKAGTHWKKTPGLMMMYRAAEFMINARAPHTTFGMYSKEALIDMEMQESGTYQHAPDPTDENSLNDYNVTVQQAKDEEPYEAAFESIETAPINLKSVNPEPQKEKSQKQEKQEKKQDQPQQNMQNALKEIIGDHDKDFVKHVCKQFKINYPPKTDHDINKLADAMVVFEDNSSSLAF